MKILRVWYAPVLSFFCALGVVAEAQRPNILFLFADDMGWNGTQATGSDFYKTPNLDQLSKEGMTFTHAYSSGANCVPSRACLMSGQYTPRHGRYGVRDPVNFKKPASQKSLLKMRLKPVLDSLSLPKDSPTIAEALSEAGYATGCFGKWQNGKGKENSAKGRGFSVATDENALKEKVNDDPKGVYSVAADVCDFMETHRDRPFFAYVSYHGIHSPLQARPETLKRFQHKEPGKLHNHPLYAACTYDLDDSAGIILKKLDQLGLRENTIVVFSSDNGGVRSSMEALRGAKGCYYEGGIRVPLFVRWPGIITPGTQCSVPVNNIDFYPTFLALAGSAAPEGKLLDGANMLPLFTGAKSLERDSLFWHYPGYQSVPVPRGRDTVFRTPPVSVMRKGDWKLHLFYEEWVLDGGSQDPAGSKAVELYNLKDDPGEHSNLAARKSGKRDELLADLLAWLKETGAPMPSEPNPAYDPPEPAGTQEKQ